LSHARTGAFAAECIGSERDWSRVLHACPVPIRLYQGDQDPQSPVQTIRELKPLYPTVEVVFLPDNGQLLFFREWRRVLDAIPEMLITSA
jgi:pimeloyl-ACP methyl ester carboxylesterase